MKHIESNNIKGLDYICEFLDSFEIEWHKVNIDKYGFSRSIEFTVNEQSYIIVWFKNESTLRIGDNTNAPRVKFKYVYFDNCFPLQGGNRSIAFSYTKNKVESFVDRMFPYESFRIPLNR